MRWGRIVGLAFALEAVLFATLLPLIPKLTWTPLMVAIAAGCLVFGYAAGWLVARGLSSGAALHGALVGVLATLIYLAINLTQPGGITAAMAFYGPPLFVGINALRIVGCVAGALTARRPAAAAAAV